MEAQGPALLASLGPRCQGCGEGWGLGPQGHGRAEAKGETLAEQRRPLPPPSRTLNLACPHLVASLGPMRAHMWTSEGGNCDPTISDL